MNLRLEFKKVYSSAPKILEYLKNILEAGGWLEPNIFLITTGLANSTLVFRGHFWKFHFFFNWPLEFPCPQPPYLSPIYWDGGCLDEDIQGYWRNNKWNFQGWIKINMEFPKVTKKKSCGIPRGLWFICLKISEGSGV